MTEPDGVPDTANEDVPPEGEDALVPVKYPDGEHRRDMDRIKIKFATRLIGACVGAVVLLSGLQYGLQVFLPETDALNPAIDLTKLLATTALGFVFGRTLDQKDN